MLTPYYGDIYKDNVVYQTHCEAIPPIDVSNSATTLVGSAVSLSGSSNSGSGSLSFPGSGNNYIRLPSTAGLLFSGEFTLEFFVKNYSSPESGFCNSAGSTHLYNGSFKINGTSVTCNPTSTSFQFCAVTRDASNVVRTYVGTAKVGEATISGNIDFRSIYFGKYVPNNNLYFSGQLDDIRITNGVARYVGASLTIPTAPKIYEVQPNGIYIPVRPTKINQNYFIHRRGL